MQNFTESAKDLFFEENFLLTYEQKRDELLKFFSEDAAKQKVTFEIEKYWDFIQTTLKEEIDLIFCEGKKRLTIKELEQLENEIQLVREKFNFDAIRENTKIASNLGSIKWSNSFLENIFKMAKESANEKNYKISTSLFHLLTILEPMVCDFWIGLGISLQESNVVSEAITIYEIANKLTNNQHPLPLLYLSECLKEIGSLSQAKSILKSALSIMKKDSKFQIYASEANRIQNLIH